ncbi:MAG: hypothetical protein AAF560_32865 [Acidobacteriota bacterium]
MKHQAIVSQLLSAAAGLALLTAPVASTFASDVAFDTRPVEARADKNIIPSEVSFETSGQYESLSLRVSDPNGEVSSRVAEAASTFYYGSSTEDGKTRVDGLYTYELHGRLAPEENAPAGKTLLLDSGFFSIKDGAFITSDEPEGGILNKQLIAEDLIVDGSACVGGDCVDGEEFSFMTLKLKENNTRLMFQDTSSGGTFPGNDWALVANESDDGGANAFMIWDCGASSTDCSSATAPFTVMAGAPASSLFVSANGRLGVGTSTPDTNINIVDGNTPTLRLEQDGSAGFSQQLWDIAGNEINFFIRDTTNASNLPFRIMAGAADDALVIDAAGEVGIGTDSPEAKLDVRGDIALTGVVDGRDIAADGSTLDAHVNDFNNPHQVTAAQVGADPAGTAETLLAAHVATLHANDTSGQPLAISEGGTGAQDPFSALLNLGAASQTDFNAHATDTNNPHQVTAAQVGAASSSELSAHTSDFNNPHQVTAAQVGAASSSELSAHTSDFNNPHQVTAAQVGADPAGTADTAVAVALALHESTFNHANIPSALPVPVDQGGTGATDAAAARAALGIEEDATKVGIVAQIEFVGGARPTATVLFATPFPAGTSYAVTMSAYSSNVSTTFAPSLLSKDENGFTIALGAPKNQLVEVNWMARPVTE